MTDDQKKPLDESITQDENTEQATENTDETLNTEAAQNAEDQNEDRIGEIEATEFGKMHHVSIVDEMEKSYLDYAMSVIVSRALPDVRDGLKPVHRRILFSMHSAGIHHTSSSRNLLVSLETFLVVITLMVMPLSMEQWFV